MLCLSNIGTSLANAFKYAYNRTCCKICTGRYTFKSSTTNNSQQLPKITEIHQPATYETAVSFNKVKLLPRDSDANCRSIGSAYNSVEASPISTMSLLKSNTRAMNIYTKPKPECDMYKMSYLNQSRDGNSETESIAECQTTCNNCLQDDPSSVFPALGDCTYQKGYIVTQDSSPEVDTVQVISINEGKSQSGRSDRVPISLVSIIVAAYILAGAIVFSMWEDDWDLLNGAYFCFITLSTIGFGDLVPGQGTFSTNTEHGQVQLFLCCIYLLVGLAIIAMAFNLVQEEVTTRARNFGKMLGIIKTPDADDV